MSKPKNKRLAIVCLCSDWRLWQQQVRCIEQIQTTYNVETDVIALPGPDGLVLNADRSNEREVVAGWVRLLANAHDADMLIVCPHYNCAGCPADDTIHDENSEQLVAAIKAAAGFTGEVVALCATRAADDCWPLKELARA